MKVAVVRPSANGGVVRPAIMPQDFALLPALTPHGVELSYYDEWLDPLPDLFEEDVVALMVDAPAAHRAHTLADRCRQQGRAVVMWGRYPTAEPEEAKRYADAVLCGGVFLLWEQAMDDLAQGALQPFYVESESLGEVLTAPPAVPALADYDYTLFTPGLYPTGAVITVPMWAAPPNEVALVPQKKLYFAGKSFFSNEALTDAWLAGVAPLGKRWACHIGVEEAQNPRLLQMMYDAGCRLVLLDAAGMGLLQQGRPVGALCGPEEMIGNIHGAGLMICACFEFGDDGDVGADGLTDLGKALAFALKNHLAGAVFVVTQGSGHTLMEQCRVANRRFWAAGRRWWHWLVCRANRRQITAYSAMVRNLKRCNKNNINDN